MSQSENSYIQPKAAWEKLSKAMLNSTPVYINGMSSYGKTELIQRFLHGKTFLYYTTQSPDSDKLADFEKHIDLKRKSPLPVVFDDTQFYSDEENRTKVIWIASRKDVWPIFISRSEMLDWLIPFCTRHEIISIGEKELALNDAQLNDYFISEGIHLSLPVIRNLQNFIDGNPYAMRLAARALHENLDTSTLISRLSEIFSQFMQHNVTKFWSEDLRDFFIKMSVVDSFSEELAVAVTQNPNARKIINQACNIGNFLIKEGDSYKIRPIPLAGWRHQANKLLSNEEVAVLRQRAALYYEKEDELEKAIFLYSENGDIEGVKNILMKNSAQNPSNGHYAGLTKYYFTLSDKEIENSVILMSGMSMTCSMCFKIEESEKWYNKIKECESSLKGAEKNEARRRIAYLDIALPHRGSGSVLKTMKSIGTLISTKGLELPEFSVTSNLPSIMNGGKDFCNWSLKDRAIARKYGSLLSVVLGRNGKCLVNLALAESFYEKNENDSEMLSFLSKGQLEAELEGNIEMEFVAAVLLIRFYLSSGQTETAELQYTSFERACAEQKAFKLYPNLRALRCRMDLLSANKNAIQVWLEKYAPDENTELIALFRYQYLTKIRCYISMGKLIEAFSLIEKMSWYAKVYERTYIDMECQLLRAIVLFKQNDKKWQKEIKSALEKTRYFSFSRIISQEGSAIHPLLAELQKDYEQKEKAAREKAKREGRTFTAPPQTEEQKWLNHVSRLAERMSRIYPEYCTQNVNNHIEFSENALTILHLQMAGLSATKISEITGISFENVRYHIKQNYKKLGAKTKSEAIIAAKEIGLEV